MQKLENLKLVEVSYNETGKKVTFTFLDEEAGLIRDVHFNKQAYKDGKYVDDPEKAATVDKWCEEYFGTAFENLSSCVGVTKDIYACDNFNSLWESQQVEKFDESMEGKIIRTQIKEVVLDDYFIKIRYEYKGKLYESKQTLGKYLESMKKWFVDPIKQAKEIEKFEKKYGVSIDDRDKLIGKDIMVEIKKAFGKSLWGDIKAMDDDE